jgi:hypothetical protein
MSPFIAVIDAFNRANVSYVVVGGFATVLHGYVRTTADIDFVIALDSVNALAAVRALESLDFVPRLPVLAESFANDQVRASWTREKGMTVFSLYKRDNPLIGVDLFVNYPLDFSQLLARSVEMDLGGVKVRTCDIDDLIAMKSAVGRPRDLDDIKHLKQIRDAE